MNEPAITLITNLAGDAAPGTFTGPNLTNGSVLDSPRRNFARRMSLGPAGVSFTTSGGKVHVLIPAAELWKLLESKVPAFIPPPAPLPGAAAAAPPRMIRKPAAP